jgi:hypothetical protein
MHRFAAALLVAAVLTTALVTAGLGQGRLAFLESFDHPAIAYSTTPPADPASVLDRALASGDAHLTYEGQTGYLRALLRALDVPVDSQLLVYSQGSLQGPDIGPARPRAIYFNDTVAVGYVQGGVLEIASQDPRLGTIFYTLDQSRRERPRLERSRECLRCHIAWETFGAPGLFVLSTIPPVEPDGYTSGGIVDHRFPFEERWAGWYVTGDTGRNRHMGNGTLRPGDGARSAATTRPLASLEGVVDTAPYLAPHSDVAALMVLEHQTRMGNLLTYAAWEARIALAADGAGAGVPGLGPARPPSAHPLPPRVMAAVDELVDYMLFVDEAPLAGPVRGSSQFAERFARQGPRDGQGRSLRDLDLTTRLLRYPCSYLIYSPAFDALPDPLKAEVYRRLSRVLSGQDQSERFRRLTPADRQAILEMLRATKADLPPGFGAR